MKVTILTKQNEQVIIEKVAEIKWHVNVIEFVVAKYEVYGVSCTEFKSFVTAPEPSDSATLTENLFE